MSYHQNFINTNLTHSDSDGDGYGVIHAGTCKLVGFIAENQSGGTRWVQVHDGYSAGAVPMLSIKALSGQQVSLDLSTMGPVSFSTGLVVVSSSTGDTYTASANTDFFWSIFWI